MKKVIPFLTFCLLTASLLNYDVFGSPTLFALYASGYVGFMAIILMNIKSFKRPNTILVKLPTLLFLGFGLYQILHNFYNQNFMLRHYYLVFTIMLFTSIAIYLQHLTAEEYAKYKNSFFVSILILTNLQFAFILLQCFTIIRVTNSAFLCTGTWINPNVTAMFLAVSLFTLFEYLKVANKIYIKRTITITIFCCLFSLLLLNCRSAILATVIILVVQYKATILQKITEIKDNFKTVRSISTILIGLFLAVLFSSFLVSKVKSTQGRINIWNNAIKVIKTEPVFGYGLGQFENKYNKYAITLNNPKNEHVNTAYNDFIEIAMETGIVGLLFYLGFIACLFYTFFQNKTWHYLSLLIALVAIQATNFLWQAVPAYLVILFLLTFAIHENSFKVIFNLPKAFIAKAFIGTCFVFNIISFLFFCDLMNAHGKLKEISRSNIPNLEKIDPIKTLGTLLGNHSFYYSAIASLYLKANEYENALNFYKAAMKKSSEPNLYENAAQCYANLKNYDSAIYLLADLEKLEPKKFYPNLAYMNVLIDKGDTLKATIKAIQILRKDIVINNKRVREIKKYANSYLKTKNKINILKLN